MTRRFAVHHLKLVTPRFNIQNMNRQFRLYQQGMTPLVKTVPGRGSWERLRGWPECEVREHAKQPIHNKVPETLVFTRVGGDSVLT